MLSTGVAIFIFCGIKVSTDPSWPSDPDMQGGSALDQSPS
jgi:hypothetical protein